MEKFSEKPRDATEAFRDRFLSPLFPNPACCLLPAADCSLCPGGDAARAGKLLPRDLPRGGDGRGGRGGGRARADDRGGRLGLGGEGHPGGGLWLR